MNRDGPKGTLKLLSLDSAHHNYSGLACGRVSRSKPTRLDDPAELPTVQPNLPGS